MIDNIISNSFDEVEYGTERAHQSRIEISPVISDKYEDTLSDNMEVVYTKKLLYEQMASLYEASPYYVKYGKDTKKIERSDIAEIYYYFKDILLKSSEYNLVDIFCAVAEFFELNYKLFYNDIISLEDKARILELLENDYGLQKEFSRSNKLF